MEEENEEPLSRQGLGQRQDLGFGLQEEKTQHIQETATGSQEEGRSHGLSVVWWQLRPGPDPLRPRPPLLLAPVVRQEGRPALDHGRPLSLPLSSVIGAEMCS